MSSMTNRQKMPLLIAVAVAGLLMQDQAAFAQHESYGFKPSSPQDLFRCEKKCGRGTLFHWSHAGPQSGGPNLNEPIVTDRPDFTEASSTVGFGVAQIEAGYTYTRNNDAGELSEHHSLGEPLLRFGVFDDWLEGRLAVFPSTERSLIGATTTRTSTVDALYVGAKIGLTPQVGALPEMAIIPQATILTGSDTETDFLHGVNWLFAWELCEGFSLAGSTQVNRQVDGMGNYYYAFARSAALGYSITDRLGSYVEYYSIAPQSGAAASTEHYGNGGFTYLISDDVQWDIRVGKGLNSAADDTFFGTGLSVRFK